MVADYTKVVKHEGLPVGDYVSPGFVKIFPDPCFPNLVVGDKRASKWPYARLQIPHARYVDKRAIGVGFLNRDEAHILYNTALKFRGKTALEIGCWLGWSACHLALAGVELDVIDPVLENGDFYESVKQSLSAAGVLESVRLRAGYSPQEVENLATELNRQWSLIFIDGNHEAPGPITDAIACEKYAAQDAIILFHDLNSPDVAQGLDYFKEKGWKTLIYQTAQIMGVAWRGNVEPVEHYPDPVVEWLLPEHLKDYGVSGVVNGAMGESEGNPREEIQGGESSLLPFNLKTLNFIVFPDWNQPEDEIGLELSKVIRAIWKDSDVAQMTLLIEASNISESEAALALSGAVMNIVMEEEIEENEEPEICLVAELSDRQWSALLPRLHSRIQLENENQQMVENTAINLPSIQLDPTRDRLPIEKPPSVQRYQSQIVQLVEQNPGQLSVEEYAYITDAVSDRSPGNFLIFGVGKDSSLWREANTGGKTVFLEDNSEWLNHAIANSPGIEAYGVEYGTLMQDWLDLLVQYNRGNDCLLLELPASIWHTQWDFIFVDAPAGYAKHTPGRMKSIYTAAHLAFQSGKADVFVHDCDRIVENIYAGYFLHEENLITEIGKTKHYKIRE